MFTGLVETVGTVRAATGDSPRRLTIDSTLPTDQIVLGESVAIDGCCLTVVEIAGDSLSFEAATETLARTTLARLRSGDRVNLERALAVGDRLGGHMVQGHVDGTGRIAAIEDAGDGGCTFTFEVPSSLQRYLIEKGSISIDGLEPTLKVTRAVTAATIKMVSQSHRLPRPRRFSELITTPWKKSSDDPRHN